MSDKELSTSREMRKSLSGELRLSASDYDSSERVYEKVRSWYLARLRKAAVEETTRNVNLTPAALIVADREFVERLILEKTSQTKKAAGQVIGQRDYVALLSFSYLGGIVLMMSVYCVLERHFDVISTAAIFFATSIGRLIGEAAPDFQDNSVPPYVRLFPVFLIGWPVVGGLILVLISQLKPKDGG
jgi:hypothetical protein